MGWVVRGARRYFYRTVRLPGRRACQYLGSGELAELVAEALAIGRAAREERRAARARARAAAAEVDRRVRRYSRDVDQAVAAILSGAGFWRPDRRWWRRKRHMSTIQPSAAAREPEPIRFGPLGDSTSTMAEWLLGLFRARRDSGSEDGSGEGSNPIERLWIDPLRAEFASVRRELTGPDPSPLERLLADRTAVCWIDCVIISSRSAVESDPFLIKLHDRAYHRFLTAAQALAKVRRLAVPIRVQVAVLQAQVTAPDPAGLSEPA
jgi:hypothetical protein